MVEPLVRKGMPPVRLDRDEFERRYRDRFRDSAFSSLSPELDAIKAAAWDAYSHSRICKGVDIDRYRRVVAVCSVGEQDIGERIVRAGFAFDWPRYSKGKYAGAQKEAERAGRGVWAGSYVLPRDYRACRWGQWTPEPLFG